MIIAVMNAIAFITAIIIAYLKKIFVTKKSVSRLSYLARTVTGLSYLRHFNDYIKYASELQYLKYPHPDVAAQSAEQRLSHPKIVGSNPTPVRVFPVLVHV